MFNKIKTVIQNVVASVKVNQKVNLNSLVRTFPNVEYKPEVFPGAPFHLEKPKSCTLIFGSGKMVCTGTKSEEEAKLAIGEVVKKLREAKIIKEVNKTEVIIQNIVATADLGISIDLESAFNVLSEKGKVMYEPEQFPGLIYRMKEPKVVFLVFTSGKSVCAGAKTEEDIYRAVEELAKILEESGVLFK